MLKKVTNKFINKHINKSKINKWKRFNSKFEFKKSMKMHLCQFKK